MVSGAPERGSRGSMWAVVVLGIITAVFAWVWLGGRGEKKAAESPEKAAQTGANSLPEHSDRKVSALTHPESHDTQLGKQPVQATGEASLASELNPSESNARKDEVSGQDDNHSHPSHAREEQITPRAPLEEDLVHQEEKKVQISQDGLEANEEFQQTGALHSPGLKKKGVQVNESVSPLVSSTDQELVGAREQVYPCVGEDRVEDLKPSEATKERLEPTNEEGSDVIVPDKVVPINAKVVTGLMDLVDDVRLLNGSEEETATDLMNGNVLNVTVSPKQVNRTASENNFDQYDHNKSTSSEQSDIDLAADAEPSATLEAPASPQVNGYIAENINVTETRHAEVSAPQKLEGIILASQMSPTEEQCNVSHSSNSKEGTPDFRGLSIGDGGCFSTQSEAKLHDMDLQRTKRVAAVQPIPQNVSLGFKVHYVTHSDSQLIAVIGDHEKLGEWENYVPLTCDKDGYWSHLVTLPADANIEWKFVMVENGKIRRWEECNNRHLRTAHEDVVTQQWWGYP